MNQENQAKFNATLAELAQSDNTVKTMMENVKGDYSKLKGSSKHLVDTIVNIHLRGKAQKEIEKQKVVKEKLADKNMKQALENKEKGAKKK